MFRKFFTKIVGMIKNAIEKKGLIKFITDAIQAGLLASGLTAIIKNYFKKWSLDRKIKKIMNRDKEEKANNQDTVKKDILDGVTGVRYDKNGYRMSTAQMYAETKQAIVDVETLYTDELNDMMYLIKMFEPEVLVKHNNDEDEVRKMLLNKNITEQQLLKRYGLDKQTQLKRYFSKEERHELSTDDREVDPKAAEKNVKIKRVLPTLEELQKVWEEPEADKVGINSFVPAGYVNPDNIKEFVEPDVKVYAAAEELYGAHLYPYWRYDKDKFKREQEDYNHFHRNCSIICEYMNIVSKFDKPQLAKWLKLGQGDLNKVWFVFMRDTKDDEIAMKQIEQKVNRFSAKLQEHGHTTMLYQDVELQKMDEILQKLYTIEFEQRSNTAPDYDQIKQILKNQILTDLATHGGNNLSPEAINEYISKSLNTLAGNVSQTQTQTPQSRYEYIDVDEEEGEDDWIPTEPEEVDSVIAKFEARAAAGEKDALDQLFDMAEEDYEDEEEDYEDDDEEIVETSEYDSRYYEEWVPRNVRAHMEAQEAAYVPKPVPDLAKDAKAYYDSPAPVDMLVNQVYVKVPKGGSDYSIYERASDMVEDFIKSDNYIAASEKLKVTLLDDDSKEYNVFRVSSIMAKKRRDDIDNGIPTEFVVSDFMSNDEQINARKSIRNSSNGMTPVEFRKSVAKRTETYKEWFTQQTMIAICQVLKNNEYDSDVVVGIIGAMNTTFTGSNRESYTKVLTSTLEEMKLLDNMNVNEIFNMAKEYHKSKIENVGVSVSDNSLED